MKTQEIRDRFRDFFVARGHEAWASDSLVPRNDPTLLFSSAGMVQFKPYFRGEMGDVLKRATTCQKCFRTTDIEQVGYTERHHTFFEMLGNFSFGDYFKKEAIRWAWEFSIDAMKIPRDRIWVSVYEEDDESEEIWKNETDVDPRHIVRMGAEDNFWPASGILGPSGPCSELYYDKGPQYGTGREGANPADPAEDERFTEYWNLVFTQFDRQADGSLPPLGRQNIDTGMGLERLACIMQGVDSNYETDLLRPIIGYFEDLSGMKFRDSKAIDVSFRVLADHVRAATFLLTDQVTPSNAGRGYVLRRIMRRAVRHGLNLGIENNLFSPAMEVVSDIYGKEYGDLVERLKFTRRVAAAEEEAFRQTISRGLIKLEEMIGELESGKEKSLPGDKAFTLYDTYGFPPDLTSEILKERGFEGYGEAEFETCMEEQRKRAQAAWRGSGETKVEIDVNVPASTFTGYDSMCEESRVIALFKNGKRVESALAGSEVEVVVEKTPFYAESGGQMGDKGIIEGLGERDVEIRIETTRKSASGVFVHFGVVERGELRVGDEVKLTVDKDSRHPTMKNHTATHLLQAALRGVLGDHVKQSGSLVSPEHLRFDFTHYESVKPEELREIETRVNRWVYENHPVHIETTSIDKARERGAMALFGEKYGDIVRTVEVAGVDNPEPVSLELCGGTHVRSTGEIGSFRIVSESSISAGNRRIEAVTGPRAFEEAQRDRELLRSVANALKSSPDETPDRVNRLQEQLKQLERENRELKQKLLSGEATDLRAGAETLNGVTVLAKQVDIESKEDLQAAMDGLMNGSKSFIAMLAAPSDGKVTFVCGVSDDLTSRFDAGKLVKETAAVTGGGGGGRKNRAMAGGKDASKTAEALSRFKELIGQA
ncbi:MAG: alanine--tRNA ligase [bacterium]|nr:alanine--tRNA ligase [bacterium]